MASISVRNARLAWPRLMLSAVLLLWLFVCARQLSRQLDHPSQQGMVLCAVLILAPLLVLNIARLPIYLLALYAALVPFSGLLVTGAGVTLTKMLAIVMGCVLIVSMIAMRRAVKPSATLLVLVVLTAYVGATVFWAIDPSKALATYSIYLNLVLLYAAISLYPITPGDAKLVFGCALCGALAAAGYGVALFSHGQQVVESRLYIGWNDANGIDPNEYAATLLTPIAVALLMCLRSRVAYIKIAWAAALLLLFAGMMVSGSRGGIISFAVMVLFLLCASRYRRQLLALVPIVLVGVIASPIALRFMRGDVTSGDLRFDIWKIGIASLHQYWLAGAGIGNFRDAYIQYFLATPHHPLSWDRPAHSILIQSAVEYGIFGLVLVLVFWYRTFRELANVRGDSLVADLCVGLRAGVLGLFVAGFSLDIMLTKYVWLTFSLIAIMRSMLVTSGAAIEPPARERSKPPVSRIAEPIGET